MASQGGQQKSRKTVDPLPLQNQGNSQKSIAMSCKMLDYWMLSRNIWKPPKPAKKHQKHAKNMPKLCLQNSPRWEHAKQSPTAPHNSQGCPQQSPRRTDQSTIAAPQHHPGKSRSSARLHHWQSPSEESEPGNLEMNWNDRNATATICQIPREIGSWPQIRSCRLIRKFRTRAAAGLSSCGCFNGCFNLSETP